MKLNDRYTRNQIIQVAGAIVAAIGFILFPWILNISGIQLTLNVLSSLSLGNGGVFVLIVAIAIIGMFVSLKDSRLRWSCAVLIVAVVGYYIIVTQGNSLFRFGNFSFLGLGVWITLIGGVIGVIEIIGSRNASQVVK